MKKILSLFAAVLFAGSMMAADLLNIDFTQGQGDWTINNILMPEGTDFIWAQTSNYGMKATAYFENTNHESEAWLISPAIDLSEVETANMLFSHARKFGNLEQLSVRAKAGDGEWAVLEVSAWPDGSNWNFVDAEANLAAYVGKADVQIAFVYTSSSSAAATWEIKTVSIVEGEILEPDVIFLPADFAGQGTSSTGSEVLVEKGGVTVSTDKGFGHEAALRIYKDGSFSIVSAEEQIGKIVFTFGSYQGEAKDGGMASVVVVNGQEFVVDAMASAAWIEKIQIFFGEFEPEPEPEPEVTPEVPEGVLTCAAAAELAATYDDPTADEKEVEVEDVVVRGFVTFCYDASEGQQSAWLADLKSAKAGVVQAYYANVEEPVVKGDYVEVSGKLVKFYKVGKDGKPDEIILEIKRGNMQKVEPLAVENVFTTVSAQKVMIDGVLYIIRDNKMFDVRGTQVR